MLLLCLAAHDLAALQSPETRLRSRRQITDTMAKQLVDIGSHRKSQATIRSTAHKPRSSHSLPK